MQRSWTEPDCLWSPYLRRLATVSMTVEDSFVRRAKTSTVTPIFFFLISKRNVSGRFWRFLKKILSTVFCCNGLGHSVFFLCFSLHGWEKSMRERDKKKTQNLKKKTHPQRLKLITVNTEKNMKKATLSSANLYLRYHLEQGKGPAQLQFLHATRGKGQTKTTQWVTNHPLYGANARLRRT